MNENVITQKKLQCEKNKRNKKKKKQGQKRMHWWGVADHQSAICH